jgi:8-oxo-dGTP diphosphatase
VSLWSAFLDLITPIFPSSRIHGATGASGGPKTSRERIRAAGGVVWRRRDVAIVHRKRYGDWTLPKGKVREGESLRDAALREVKEETGCEATIRDLAGVLRYEVKGIPKVVVFWNMDLIREGAFRADEEVDQLEWVAPEKALATLDYPKERDLLAQQVQGEQADRKGQGCWLSRGVFKRWCRLRILLQYSAHQRLVATLGNLRAEVEARVLRFVDSGADDLEWVNPIIGLMNQSAHAAKEGRLDAGWRYLHASDQLGVYGLDMASLRARLESLKQEALADKFGAWRIKAILSLVGKAEQTLGRASACRFDEARAQSAEAVFLRNEASNNTYYRVATVRWQLLLLYFAGGVALGVLLWVNPFSGMELSSWRMSVSVALFGALGAACSAILSLAKTQTTQRIPEKLVNSWVTVLRPILGAMVALAAFALLRAEFIKLGDVTSFKVLAVAFAAGFSDRLVTRAAGSLADRASGGQGPAATGDRTKSE